MAEMHEVILRVHLSNSCCPWRRSPSTHNTWTPPTTQCSAVTKLKGTRLTGAAAASVTAAGQPIPARTPSPQMSAQRPSPHPTPPSLPATLWQLPSSHAASGGAGQPKNHPACPPATQTSRQPASLAASQSAAQGRSKPLRAAQGRTRTPKVAECRSRPLRAAQACKSASWPDSFAMA